jgi:hypothetical protein
MRTSTSSTSFDKNLLTVRSSGNVGIGTMDPQTPLDVRGTIYIKGSTNAEPPSTGNYGGSGDRLVLWNGGTGAHPYSLGIDGYTLWYSVPQSSRHAFYVNGDELMRITNTGMSIGNTSPWAPLNLGSVSVSGSDGYYFIISIDYWIILKYHP